MDATTAAQQVIDSACLKVKELIPDADYITVGRTLMMRTSTGPAFGWDIRFSMPRRDKAYRVMKNRMEWVSADGETLEAAIEKAVLCARYHRTGSFE